MKIPTHLRILAIDALGVFAGAIAFLQADTPQIAAVGVTIGVLGTAIMFLGSRRAWYRTAGLFGVHAQQQQLSANTPDPQVTGRFAAVGATLVPVVAGAFGIAAGDLIGALFGAATGLLISGGVVMHALLWRASRQYGHEHDVTENA